MKLKTIKQVIKHDFCLGCGLCAVVHKSVAINEIKNKFKPSYEVHINLPNHIEICPASGYNIYSIGYEIHKSRNHSYELGWYENLSLARTLDEEIKKHASSGGIITAIALFMLQSGKADGVICTKYDYYGDKVRPKTFIARNKEQLLQAQGSKYCPTKSLEILSELSQNEKYVLIGTPCHIAGWNKFKTSKYYNNINIVLTITNFCGGYRDFREIDYFVKKIAKFDNVRYFQHRGDGVPGQMRIESNSGDVFTYPYPNYASLSPFQKNKRCVYCIDATGELADFSCGDAWLERVRNLNDVWSIVISRNDKAVKILNEMTESQLIVQNAISDQEVIYSQKLNLSSKKYRQYKRIRIQKIFLQYIPSWHNCINDKEGSYISEIKILIIKWVFQLKNKIILCLESLK